MDEATASGTAPVPTPASLPHRTAVAVPSQSSVPNPGAMRPPAVKQGSDPSKFGRVTDDGTVYLTAPEGELVVGQWAAGPPVEGLAFFGRKYDDLVVEIEVREVLDDRVVHEST